MSHWELQQCYYCKRNHHIFMLINEKRMCDLLRLYAGWCRGKKTAVTDVWKKTTVEKVQWCFCVPGFSPQGKSSNYLLIIKANTSPSVLLAQFRAHQAEGNDNSHRGPYLHFSELRATVTLENLTVRRRKRLVYLLQNLSMFLEVSR